MLRIWWNSMTRANSVHACDLETPLLSEDHLRTTTCSTFKVMNLHSVPRPGKWLAARSTTLQVLCAPCPYQPSKFPACYTNSPTARRTQKIASRLLHHVDALTLLVFCLMMFRSASPIHTPQPIVTSNTTYQAQPKHHTRQG